MAGNQQFTTEDRDFFSTVVRAIFMNPFSDERSEVLLPLSPGFSREKRLHTAHLATIAPSLNDRITKLERKGIRKSDQLKGNDRQLLEYAYLLQVYLRFVPNLDELIQNQLDLRSEAAEAPFSERLLTDLKARSFSDPQSLRYFALFYQLRRAFHFIDDSLVGDSSSMKQLRLSLWNNVFTHDVRIYDRHLFNRMEDFSTLLLGETGTGKGSAAAAIGRSGYIPFDRKKKKFVQNFTETFISINLSQFPESLIESELFGHRKGSFTGAVENHQGLFEKCSPNGALFLDEIGDVSVPVQIKLLQVLQERTFTPVGSHDQKRFAGRVIAATNRSLNKLRKGGNFRDDFFYRLCSDVITVPPLRQRIEESPSEMEQLVDLLVTRTTGQENSELTAIILETLARDLPPNYFWPGNVRELEQAIRSILLTGHYSGDLLSRETDLETGLVEKIQAGTLKAGELLSQYCNLLYKRLGTYEEVAKRTGLDRRTVKKYVTTPNKTAPHKPR